MDKLTPKFTPEQQAARKRSEDASREAARFFVPGSPRHTQEVIRLLRGGRERMTQRIVVPSA